ncbi:MAG: putative rane protein [Sphingomonadales bacterium]|jgi:cytochrome c oxidase assembly factor CtaG|nr:putative rane protein [Sphingomonadales bacterium]
MLSIRRVAFAALLALSSAAFAHGDGEYSGPPGWTLGPWVTLPLALLLLTFLVGQKRLASRSAIERRLPWQFLAGWAVLALSLVSPLHEAGERSFALHMTEHELIMLVATMLLAASGAGGTLAWGLPRPLRQLVGGSWKSPLSRLWKRLTEPLTATAIQAVVMWVWHAPSLFDRSLDSRGWHVAQHLSFVIASLLFWVAMFHRQRGGYLLSAACLFLTSMVEGALGALMTFSTSPWYSGYAAMGLSGIGLDPITDQRLAGLLMWIPGGLVHGAVAVALLYRWLTVAEARSSSIERSSLTRYR